MSDRAIITIRDDYEVFYIFMEHDGYCSNVLGLIYKATDYAMDFKAFSAGDFTKAFLIAGGKECNSFLYLYSNTDNLTDIDYFYDISCIDGELKISTNIMSLSESSDD